MDPKVCGKLLTYHRRGYGVDAECRKRPQDGISRVQKVAAVEIGFRGAPGWFWGTCVYIGGRSRSVELRGWGARPGGQAHLPASWPPRLFLDVHSKSSGSRLFQKSRSRRFHSVWTPFDIPFLWNTEIGKKTSIWARPPVNRLVPKIIWKSIVKPIKHPK